LVDELAAHKPEAVAVLRERPSLPDDASAFGVALPPGPDALDLAAATAPVRLLVLARLAERRRLVLRLRTGRARDRPPVRALRTARVAPGAERRVCRSCEAEKMAGGAVAAPHVIASPEPTSKETGGPGGAA